MDLHKHGVEDLFPLEDQLSWESSHRSEVRRTTTDVAHFAPYSNFPRFVSLTPENNHLERT
jgi:hypothetical protein